ncbi:MAG: hypothetical protein NWQ13_08900 [Glaciimonas sp.]|nr:hypothetical protein [Glaciimonas sp.]
MNVVEYVFHLLDDKTKQQIIGLTNNALAFGIAMNNAQEEAEKLIDLMEVGGLSDFVHLPPIDGLTLLAVMSKKNDAATANASALITEAKKLQAIKAADIRHQSSRQRKEEALRLFQTKKWQSTRQASKAIAPKLKVFCNEHGLPVLSEDRAAQTIYEWLCKYENHKRVITCA